MSTLRTNIYANEFEFSAYNICVHLNADLNIYAEKIKLSQIFIHLTLSIKNVVLNFIYHMKFIIDIS